MNHTFKYALGAVFGLGLVAGGFAQDNFPDVPDNHWAYEALARMKREGLLMGYPDGLWRGNRPATRYEMAVAIHATYAHLKGITDNLQSQIDELKNRQSGVSAEAFEALKRDVDGMKNWGQDIADLKRMAAEFEKELAAMGVDMEAMKKDLASLNDRVTKLEKNALPITIHGDLNLFIQTSVGTSQRFGIGTDGQLVGGTTENATRSSGLWDGNSVFHEALIKIAGTNEEGPKWDAIIGVGNMVNGYGSTPATTAVGSSRNDEANTDITFNRFAVEFDQNMIGQGVNIKLGRMGYHISPYIYQRPDTNPYFKSPMDDGKWTMDGAVLGFNFGPATLNVIFGRTDNRNTAQGIDLSGVTAGPKAQNLVGLRGAYIAADTTAGVHLNLPLGENGAIDLAYLLHNQNTPANAGGISRVADNVAVFGGEAHYKFDSFKVKGGYSQSNLSLGNDNVSNRNNFAWHVGVGYEAENWGVMVGYREIQPLFGAAGDWGRIGTWWNPTDISSFYGKAHFQVTEQLKLHGGLELARGLGKTNYFNPLFNANVNGLREGDRADSYNIGLDYQIAEGWHAMLGAEFVDFKVDGISGTATQRWYNIGFGYTLSDMAKLSLLWQISDANAKNTGLWASPVSPNGRFSGNLITTQLSVKF